MIKINICVFILVLWLISFTSKAQDAGCITTTFHVVRIPFTHHYIWVANPNRWLKHYPTNKVRIFTIRKKDKNEK